MIAAPPPAVVAYGHEWPRLAPPLPLRSRVDEYVTISHALGIDLMPWQCNALRYMTALGQDDRLLYREVAIVVARQNGKTTLLVPFVVAALRMGLRVMHTAQNRVLPRDVFEQVAEILTRAGVLKVKPRFANGQEVIKTRNGGIYRIVAPTRGGARGPSNDIVIIDELREMDDFDFISAAKPTLTASSSPQTIYLSNAGTEGSAVLNALRLRAQEDPALAYLEWSADPERKADDFDGWLESNPAMGHIPAVSETLVAEYRANSLAGTMEVFETEHLCRWVVTMRERLVDVPSFQKLEAASLPVGRQIYMGVALDPTGRRASAALAWQTPDGVALQLTHDVKLDEAHVADFGADLQAFAAKRGVKNVGHDPLTDGELAKFFRKTEKITGSRWSNASHTFVDLVQTQRLHWRDCGAVSDDLMWTARKANDEKGSFQAVRADDDRPITAALAAIRAVELASGPRPLPPRVY